MHEILPAQTIIENILNEFNDARQSLLSPKYNF